MTARDVANLHPRDIPLWLAVETAVWRLSIAAKCNLKIVEPTPRKRVNETAGYFFFSPVSKIQISLRTHYHETKRHACWGERYSLHELLDTISHEVAHCVVGRERGIDHGPKFFREFGRLMVLAEDLAIRVDIGASRVMLSP